MNRDEGDLKHQLRRALIAILNRISSNSLVKLNVAPILRINQFSNTGDGAELVFDLYHRLEPRIEEETQAMSGIISNQEEGIKRYLDSVADCFGEMPELLEGFVKKMQQKHQNFPLTIVDLDTEKMNPKDCIRAKNAATLVEGFNMMLEDLDLEKYKITLPPRREPGGPR